MKVLIRETLRTVDVNIYGTDGRQCTKEYFESYFSDVDGAYPTLEAEKEEFSTDAEWVIITERDFREFADFIEEIQMTIDLVEKKLETGENKSDYIFQKKCFLI